MKKYVIITMLILMTLPFVFIRSFYPFYRFGMFAEPISKENKLESFLIYYNNTADEKQLFYAPDVGISVSVFEAIKRKYYYKKRSKELLENLKDHYSLGETAHWKLYKVSWESEHKSDTILVYTLNP